MSKRKSTKKCCVDGCETDASVEVILYDVYMPEFEVFFEQDYTCPYLCPEHMARNERNAKGVREPRGYVQYPYSNKYGAQGFTIYRPLGETEEE